jgi:hypothetical protein
MPGNCFQNSGDAVDTLTRLSRLQEMEHDPLHEKSMEGGTHLVKNFGIVPDESSQL